MMITRDITIELLVEKFPQTLNYLSKNNIRCIRCGEPIWGTLEQAVFEKGYSETDLLKFIDDLNKIIG